MTPLEALRSLVRHVQTPRFPAYRIYSTAHDEVVHAHDLAPQIGDAGGRQEAYHAFCLQQESLMNRLGRAARDFVATVPQDTAVSLLIDHSGSMRGLHMEMALLLTQAAKDLAGAAGCPVEILGFTTVEWQGKPLRPTWMAARLPFEPGRLCALRHIIDRSFGESPAALDLMLEESICKENVDGEALLWAAARLRAVPARRRVLIVV